MGNSSLDRKLEAAARRAAEEREAFGGIASKEQREAFDAVRVEKPAEKEPYKDGPIPGVRFYARTGKPLTPEQAAQRFSIGPAEESWAPINYDLGGGDTQVFHIRATTTVYNPTGEELTRALLGLYAAVIKQNRMGAEWHQFDRIMTALSEASEVLSWTVRHTDIEAEIERPAS